MGHPEDRSIKLNTEEEPVPDWDNVLNRLESNPEEACFKEDDKYPIDHALLFEKKPVSLDVVIRLLRVCPDGFTRQTYEVARENPNTKPEVSIGK